MLRKLIHLSSLAIPVGYFFFSRGVVLNIIAPIAAGSLAIDIVRLSHGKVSKPFLRVFGPLLKQDESIKLTGATNLLIASVICVLFFDKMIAIAALWFLILGDPAASFVGRRIGKIRILHKTLEGSSACLITCLIIALIIPDIRFQAALAGAVTATVVELLSLQIDDNLLIPVLSGLVMQLVVMVMG